MAFVTMRESFKFFCLLAQQSQFLHASSLRDGPLASIYNKGRFFFSRFFPAQCAKKREKKA